MMSMHPESVARLKSSAEETDETIFENMTR